MNRTEFSARIQAMTDRLYRISYGQLSSEQDRRDAVQETLLRAWTGLPRLRREEYFETWVIRILLNVCHNQQRRARREAPLESAPEPEAAEFDGNAELRDAIRALPAKLRRPCFSTTWRAIPCARRRGFCGCPKKLSKAVSGRPGRRCARAWNDSKRERKRRI